MRVFYTARDGRVATWNDTVLTGSTGIHDRLFDATQYPHPMSLTVTGPHWVWPDLWDHAGAIAAGLQAGFTVTGDIPEEMDVPDGATDGNNPPPSESIAEAIGRRRD